MTRKEHSIRGSFSFLAAGVLLYMAAENLEALMVTRRPIYLIPLITLGIAAVFEAQKVGQRVENILGLS